MPISAWKKKRWVSKKWRDAARNQPCTLRLPCCNNNPETTVLAHRGGAGMAMKADDHDAVDACYECHKALDGVWSKSGVDMEAEFDRARIETIVNRLERGIVK